MDGIETVLVDSLGRVLVAGISYATGAPDRILTRFDADGEIDLSFGTNGRVSLGQYGRCNGTMRAVAQPNDAIVVAQGFGIGGPCTVTSVAAFRIDATGVSEDGFAPSLVAPDPNLDVALGVRADGR